MSHRSDQQSADNPNLAAQSTDMEYIPITNTYWPEFVKAVMTHPLQEPPIHLNYPICKDPMTLSHDTESPHKAWIQPCDHMVGLSCLEKRWFGPEGFLRGFFSLDPTSAIKCPVCATKAPRHPVCGHLAMDMHAPIKRADFTNVPPILSKGGLVNPVCLMLS
ncbi:hypothetical protein F53441_1293 [Fusarium austroafricanum]|uniref:RING-type domain-containing protein n=1 Tax=Fusarium austroafricanum TaxID=2364996 RepID=A0A8H4KV04_9HYPO|nr:hypothetical protein F53441_1293 [Fusarium austroafricanum]